MKKKPITAETPTTPPLPETVRDQGDADEKTRIVDKAMAREMATELAEQATVAPAVERQASTGSTPAGQAPAFDNGPLRAGTRIAEFEITEVVAQGGFGIVYKAWDHILERTVALKEYLPSSLANRVSGGSVVARSERYQDAFDTGMKSFINEAKLLAKFDHPALLKVYRFWQDRGTAFMVMPLYVGRTLKQILASLPTPPDQAWLLHIMDGVTQAIATMHADNCFHRDLAPDNIMLLEDSGQPIVLDFGAARKVISDMTQALTVILKPGYAPIEQYAEMSEMAQGAWTDIYALGAVLHNCMKGRTPPASVSRFINDSYQPLATQSSLLERYEPFFLAAVDAALAVKPQDRPQSIAEFRSLLHLTPTGSSTPLTDGTAADQTTRLIARQKPVTTPATHTADHQASSSKRGLWWIGLAVAVAVIAGIAVFLFAPSSPQEGDTTIASTAPSPQTSTQTENAVTSSTTSSPPSLPAAPAPAPYTPDLALERIVAGAAPDWPIEAGTNKATVHIDREKLEFFIKSSQAGYVYVYMKSTDQKLYLLFPNVLDQYNRIAAGERLNLPRASWPMVSAGPVGVNKFVAVVSKTALNLDETGASKESIFLQFSERIAQALHEVDPAGLSPLLGKAKCPDDSPCNIHYGAASFSIQEAP